MNSLPTACGHAAYSTHVARQHTFVIVAYFMRHVACDMLHVACRTCRLSEVRCSIQVAELVAVMHSRRGTAMAIPTSVRSHLVPFSPRPFPLRPFPLFDPPFPLRRTGSPHIGISAASLSDALSSVLCARAMLPLRASCARECANPTWREREHDTMQHTPALDSNVHVQKAKP